MHTSFKAAAENRFDRHFGGTQKGVADPYVSGYHFIYFKTLPTALTSALANDIADLGISSNNDVQNLLSASCLAVTPPGGTMNRAEFTGLGGSKWSVPTNMDYGNTLTVRFLEYSRLPIFHIFHSWFRLMREYRTGTSMLTGSAATPGSTSQYTKEAYSGTMLYWTTKPDGVTVEYSAAYTGVFPTKDPQDSFPGDVTAVDKLEIDMEFSLDWIWREKFVRDECQFWANVFHAEGVQRHGGIKIGADAQTVDIGDHTDDPNVGADVPN
jgi:hypothetical protein